MPETIEAIVDEDGRIRLPSSVSLRKDQRVLVTILEERDEGEDRPDTVGDVAETALLSEEALAKDWTREEEEKAWKHLQPDR